MKALLSRCFNGHVKGKIGLAHVFQPVLLVLQVLPVLLSLLLAAKTIAQDLEPRSYTNIPVGLGFLAVGYLYSEGELTAAPSVPLEDAELQFDTAVLGGAYTFALAGKSAKIDALAGRMCFEGSGVFNDTLAEARRCGYVDPKFRLTWNFYGAPALAMKDYRTWEQGLVVGTSMQVSAPWGTYLDDKLINPGSNRWIIRPGIGLSNRIGSWQYEVMGSVRFFEDNHDFFGDTHLEQDPLFNTQGHLIYNLAKGRWLSFNANYFRGGQTTSNGEELDNEQSNSRFGVTFSTPLSQRYSLKIYANTGLVTRIGNDFETLGIVLQYRL